MLKNLISKVVGMKDYSYKLIVLVNNMLMLNFPKGDILKQIKVNFPEVNMTMEDLKDMIKIIELMNK